MSPVHPQVNIKDLSACTAARAQLTIQERHDIGP